MRSETWLTINEHVSKKMPRRKPHSCRMPNKLAPTCSQSEQLMSTLRKGLYQVETSMAQPNTPKIDKGKTESQTR